MPESPGAGRRLLWIHQNFVSAKQTGISRAVYFIAALLQAGWTVDVICSRTGYLDEAKDTDEDLSETVLEKDGRLTLHRLGIPKDISTQERKDRGRSYFGFNQDAMTYIRKSVPRPDVIWSSSPPSTIMLPALQLALQWQVPLVLEARDLWPEVLIEGKYVTNPAVIAIMQLFEVVMLTFADHIVPVAPGFQRLYELLGIAPSKMTTNPTGGDPYFLGATPELGDQWRKEHGLEGQFLALFSGSMNESSDIPLLARAAELSADRLPHVTWLFAGSGRLSGAVKEAAAKYPTVRYLGMFPRDAMLPLFAATDVGLISRAAFPVEQLVYPGKFFDYLACGLPVLTNHIGQPSVVIDGNRCGLVLRGERSPESFVEGIATLSALPADERAAMGDRGREWIFREMNSFRMGEELAQLVDRQWPERSMLGQWGRFLGSCATGVGWTLMGRHARARKPFSSPDAEALIREASDAWHRRGNQASPRPPDYSIPLPSILSSRDA